MVSGGIAGISQRVDKEEQERSSRRGPGSELWLYDGDIATVSIVPSGDPEDYRIQDFSTYRATGMGRNGAYTYDAMAIGQSAEGDYKAAEVDSGTQLRTKFGVWLYVENVMRNPSNSATLSKNFGDDAVASWETIQSPSGKAFLQQPAGNFQMWSQGFGRSKYLWNQIVDIYDEDGALNKHKVRIRRTGSGRDDTSYSIKTIAEDAQIPSEAQGQSADSLVRPVDFFLQKERAIAAAVEKRNSDNQTTSLNGVGGSSNQPPWNVDSSSEVPSFNTSSVDNDQESLF